MDDLDRKVFNYFSGRVVPKGATKKIKDSANVPTYVLEYLLGNYCTSDDEKEVEEGIEQVKKILGDNFVRVDEAEKIKAKVKENTRECPPLKSFTSCKCHRFDSLFNILCLHSSNYSGCNCTK